MNYRHDINGEGESKIIKKKVDCFMPLSEARKRANAKYNAKAYDRIEFKVPKGEKEHILAFAEQNDGSLNKFMNRAVREAVSSSEQNTHANGFMDDDTGNILDREQQIYTDDSTELSLNLEENNRYTLSTCKEGRFTSTYPSIIHQNISVEITRQIANFLVGKLEFIYPYPFRIHLESGDAENIIMPDIAVIRDINRLREDGYHGVPLLVIEIVAPETARRDMIDKARLYERSGIPEYWTIIPREKIVQVHILASGVYQAVDIYGEKDIARVRTLDGCFIDLIKVFG